MPIDPTETIKDMDPTRERAVGYAGAKVTARRGGIPGTSGSHWRARLNGDDLKTGRHQTKEYALAAARRFREQVRNWCDKRGIPWQ